MKRLLAETRTQQIDLDEDLKNERTAGIQRATAWIVGSRMSANAFLGLNRATSPTRLFTTEESVIAWLGGFSDA